jgi:hypothetical protein
LPSQLAKPRGSSVDFCGTLIGAPRRARKSKTPSPPPMAKE